MNQRRGALTTVCTALLLVGGLTACSSSSADGGGKELHVLVGADPAHADAVRAWQARIQKDFKAKTGADVVFDSYASAGDEQMKIQTSMVSGTGPDVYQLGTTFTPVAYATGGFRVLNDADWKRIGGRDKFLPATLAMSGPDAQHDIAVPFAARPYGMVYNTEMFKAVGIAQPPTTWDEFVTDATKLTNPSAGVYGTAVDYADPFSSWKYIWTFALQSGGRLVTDDLKQARLNSPQVQDAIGHYFGLSTKQHAVDPAAAGWQSAQAAAAFANGKAAMLPMVAPTVIPTLDNSPVKGKYKFVPMPLVPFGATVRPENGLAAGSILSGDNLAIAKYSTHADLALDYIALVTSPGEQKAYYKGFGGLSPVTAAEDQLASTDPQVADFVAAEKASLPTSFTGAWSDVQLGLTNTITQTLPSLAGGKYDSSAVSRLLAKANQAAQASLDRQKH